MINNIEILSKILKENCYKEDQFFKIDIIRRRKDGNNSTIIMKDRIVKSYFFSSIKELDDLYESEIIPLCKALNARAYINMNVKTFRQTSIETMKYMFALLSTNSEMKPCKNVFSKFASKSKISGPKYWVIDADADQATYNGYALSYLQQHNVKHFIIPTPNGQHFLCEAFNLQDLNKQYNTDLQDGHFIHKTGSTLLYASLKLDLDKMDRDIDELLK